MFIRPDVLLKIQKLDLKNSSVWTATWFGAGFLSPGPGTWGSLASIPVALLVYSLLGMEWLVIGTLFLCVLGFVAAAQFTKMIGEEDSPLIVIDEAAGQWIALIAAIAYGNGVNFIMIAFSFLIFRIFDIIKPWPISWFERSIGGPAGIMGDDIIAGFITVLFLTGIHYAGLG